MSGFNIHLPNGNGIPSQNRHKSFGLSETALSWWGPPARSGVLAVPSAAGLGQEGQILAPLQSPLLRAGCSPLAKSMHVGSRRAQREREVWHQDGNIV